MISENRANSGPAQRTMRVSSVRTAFSGSGAGLTISSILPTIGPGSGMVTAAPRAVRRQAEKSAPASTATRIGGKYGSTGRRSVSAARGVEDGVQRPGGQGGDLGRATGSVARGQELRAHL